MDGVPIRIYGVYLDVVNPSGPCTGRNQGSIRVTGDGLTLGNGLNSSNFTTWAGTKDKGVAYDIGY